MKNLMFVFDRMPDQDGCTFVEVENEEGQSVNAGEWRLRDDGLAELVVPVSYSPSFDEAKERELFEQDFKIPEGVYFSKVDSRYKSMNGRIYEAGQASDADLQLQGWLACAKSRASR